MNARHPKPAILREIPPDRHAVIQASAGTGKTYTLEHLVLDRILRGVEVGEILVLTFTEKAATEMRERIRKLLRKLLELPEGAGAELAEGESWEIDASARQRIRAALQGFDAATISTIHAFCNGILGEQAFANQRLFEQTTVDARSLFGAAFVEVLREIVRDEEVRKLIELWMEEKSTEDLEDFLSDCHRARAPLMPRLDLERLEALFAAFPRGDDAEERVGDAWEGVRKSEGMGAKGMRVTTLRSRFGELAAVVQQYEANAPSQALLEAGWAVLGQAKALSDIANGLAAASSLPAELEAIARFCRELPQVLPPLAAILAERLLPPIEERLAARKRAEGLLDYDEMLQAVHETLEGEEGEPLVAQLRQRFRYAILDEFQDTDEVQWAIFRRVFLSGTENFLYAIGDPKQAIYGFRGADVGAYYAAREEILERGGAEVKLSHCFRATQDLIDAYNRIFDQEASPPYFRGKTRYDDPVRCGRPERRLTGPGGAPATPIQVFHLEEGKAEARLAAFAARAARAIRRIVRPEDPTLLWDEGEEGKEARPLTHRDIYILYRYAAEGRAIAEALRTQGIPFAFYKEEGLFQRPEAWAWLDLLRALAAPEDPSLRTRAFLSPFFGVPLAELPRTRDLPVDHPFRQRLVAWAEDARARNYERLIPRVLDESGILRRAIASGDERALTNFLHIGEFLMERGHRHAPGCEELADWLHALIEERARPERENGNQQRLETERDAVQLMTLHAAKGLEAPVVFLLSKLTKGGKKTMLHRYRDDGDARHVWVGSKLPQEIKARVEEEEREEAERLLYVAITRAKGRLYLPSFGGQRSDGDFLPLLERLKALREEDPPGFAWEEIGEEVAVVPGAEEGRALVWEEEEEDEEERFAERRRHHLGFVITSYSRMRGFRGVEEDEERIEGERMVVEPGPDDLPGGAASGIFLHDILARIPPALVPPDFEDFHGDPRIHRIFQEAARAHGIAPVHLAHAWRLVWAGLRTPLDHGGLELPRGVVGADRWKAEMEFLYPLPPAEEERGFVKGFVDLIFEAGGRIHFADWKSDSLPSFDAAYLENYVRGSYELQIRLYAIALRKLFGFDTPEAYEAGFGGAFYFFLRGMEREGGAGIYYARPSFDELIGWERELEKR